MPGTMYQVHRNLAQLLAFWAPYRTALYYCTVQQPCTSMMVLPPANSSIHPGLSLHLVYMLLNTFFKGFI